MVILGTIKVAYAAFSGRRLCLQCLVKSTVLWYFENRFKHFYNLTSLSQYLISLAPKKPREAKTWAEIAEYMSIQDQTIVDERELLEEHQFLLELELVRPFLITIYAYLINIGLLGSVRGGICAASVGIISGQNDYPGTA